MNARKVNPSDLFDYEARVDEILYPGMVEQERSLKAKAAVALTHKLHFNNFKG